MSRRSYTFTLEIDDAGSRDALQIPRNAPPAIRKIEISEESGTHGWYLSSDETTAQVYQPPGKLKVFDQGHFNPGDVLGFAEADSGSVTLQVECYL